MWYGGKDPSAAHGWESSNGRGGRNGVSADSSSAIQPFTSFGAAAVMLAVTMVHDYGGPNVHIELE
jgi:hypothetical protein